MAEAAWVELARATRRDDAKAIITAANRVLGFGFDLAAVEAKVVALLFESKFEEAVAATSGAAAAPLFLHRAFALYRCDRFAEALATLDAGKGSGEETEAALQLRAQVLYRVGCYMKSAAIYEALLETLTAEDADPAVIDDVRMNCAASLVAAGRGADIVSNPHFSGLLGDIARGKTGDYAYELLYNAACALADAGQPSLAMRALAASYAQGLAYLSEVEEETQPDKMAEQLAILRAQAAYLLQCAHYDDAAAALYAQVLALRPSDPTIVSVVNNNLAQIKAGPRDLVEAYKKLKALAPPAAAAASTTGAGAAAVAGTSADPTLTVPPAASGPALAKLPRRQVAALHYNRAVVSFLLKRWADATEALKDARSVASGDEALVANPHIAALLAHAAVLEAAVEVAAAAAGTATGTGTPTDALLEKLAALPAAAPAGTGRVAPAVALRVQLLASSGRAAEAAAALLAALAPGVVLPAAGAATAALAVSTGVPALAPAEAATLAQLLIVAGRRDAAAAVLEAAASAHSRAAAAGTDASASAKRSQGSAAAIRHILAALHMGSGEDAQAAAVFEGITTLVSAPAEAKATAMACLAMQQTSHSVASAAAAAGGGDDAAAAAAASRSKSLLAADMTLREATALSMGAGARRPSFADLSRFTDAATDALEWATGAPSAAGAAAGGAGAAAAAAAGGGAAVPAPVRTLSVGGILPPAAAGASPTAAAGGAGTGAAAALTPAEAAAAARAAARLAARKRRVTSRRAKARARYIDSLRSRGLYDVPGIPNSRPDPERWLPKRLRTYGAKGRKRAIARAGANVSTGAAQGSATGADAALTASLDVKARTDAAKAKAGAAGAAAAPAAAPSPASGKGAAGKGGRRK